MPPDYSRYGRDTNPFEPRRVTRDDVLADPERLACAIDRWEQTRDLIRDCASQRRPAFLLVVGVKGSGRSTLAHMAIREYLSATPAPRNYPERLHVAWKRIDNRNVFEQFQEWTSEMADLIRRKNLIANQHADQFDTDSLAIVQDKFAQQIARWIARVQDIANTCGLAAVIEDIPTPEFVTEAFKAFRRMEGPVVLTALDVPEAPDMKRAFRESGPGEGVIDLRMLHGPEVVSIAAQRWQGAAQPCPFDHDGLSKCLDRKFHYRGVLNCLRFMLHLRNAECPDSAKWPANDCLRLTATRICDYVSAYQSGRED